MTSKTNFVIEESEAAHKENLVDETIKKNSNFLKYSLRMAQKFYAAKNLHYALWLFIGLPTLYCVYGKHLF